MSTRIKNVIRGRLQPGKTRTTVTFPTPTSKVQAVIDRQLFEVDTDEHLPLFFIRPFSGDQYLGGGAEFGRRRIEGTRAPRPGQRSLWSVNIWTFREPVTELIIEIEAYDPFVCHLDVDYF